MNNLRSVTLTLAGGQCQMVSLTGKIFSCTASTGLFRMSFDGGDYFDAQSGSIFEAPDEVFTQLWFRNEGTASVTITFYAGSVIVRQQGYEPKRAPTNVSSGGPYVLAAGQSQAFIGSTTDPHVRQWVFSNRHATVDITLYSATVDPVSGLPVIGANPIATIFAHTNFTIETSAPIAIKNESATGGVTVDVCTIFYT